MPLQVPSMADHGQVLDEIDALKRSVAEQGRSLDVMSARLAVLEGESVPAQMTQPARQWLWTEPVDVRVPEERNWNRPVAHLGDWQVGESWGVAGRDVPPYAVADRPHDDIWYPLQTDCAHSLGRHAGTGSAQFWSDPDSPNWPGHMDRAELHIEMTPYRLGAIGKRTLWIGWSERWISAPNRQITIAQFLTHPIDEWAREYLGDDRFARLTEAEKAAYRAPGPAAQLRAFPNADGRPVFLFERRAGTVNAWSQPNLIELDTIEPRQWYDIVVAICPDDTDGRIRVWCRPTINGKQARPIVGSAPDVDLRGQVGYLGAPAIDGIQVPHMMRLRLGLYEWWAASNQPITTGPALRNVGMMRMHVGEDDAALEAVDPGRAP